MKRNPLYIAIRRNALMSAGALALGAGGAITAITMAQASTTIQRDTATAAFTNVTATATVPGGYFEADAQENSTSTLASIIQNGSVTQQTGSGGTSNVTASSSGNTIEAVADGNVLANTESLSAYTGDVLASQAVGQLNDNLTVDVLVQTSTVEQDLTDLTGGVIGLSDAQINAEARLNVSSVTLNDLAAGDYTSPTGPADLNFDGTGSGSDATTTASNTLSTVQVNDGITGGTTSSSFYPSESTGNSIRINAEVDAGTPTFGDTLSLTNSDIDAGIIGNSADSAIVLDSTGSISASSGVSSVQDNFSARLAALNTGSNIEVTLTEADDPAVIASLTGTAELTGSGIGSAAVGSSATTLNRIEAAGSINNPTGAAGVDLGLNATADVDAGFASLSAQRITTSSFVQAETISGNVTISADDVDGGTVALSASGTAADAIANEAINEARLIASGDIGATDASIAIGNLQSSAADVRGNNASSNIGVSIGGNVAAPGSLRNGGIVSVVDNRIEASGAGNDSLNVLVADGANIELDPTAVAGTTLGRLSTNAATGVTNAAGASLINVQSLIDDGTTPGSGNVRSDVVGADIFASIADRDTDALSGTVTLSRNEIDSQATGNTAVNQSLLGAVDGASGNLSAVSSVGNLQIADVASDQFVRAQIDGDIALIGNNDTSIAGNFGVNDNTIQADALSNESTNLLSMQANGVLSGVDTSGAVIANDASISGTAVEAAANATLSNAQVASDTVARPYVVGPVISDLRIATTLTAPSLIGVTSTVDNNTIDLSAQGNQATNVIDIDAASITEGNAAGSTLAALVSGQSADETTATGAGLVSTTLGETGATLDGTTTATLSGNTVSASAQGNSATSRADLAATGEISSTTLQPGLAAVGAGTQNADGGVALVSGQRAGTTSAGLDAANVNQTNLGVTLDIIGNMLPNADIIGELAGNQLSADARANFVDNTVALDGSEVSNTSAALASGQEANAVNASITSGQFAIGVNTAFPDATGVVLSITGATPGANGVTPREMEALAIGNTALNSVNVTGTSGITATAAANGTATADIGATESAEADHALANAQITRGGGADIASSLTDAAATIDLTALTSVNNATVTIADQTLLALSRANFADSEISLASTDGIASTQALTNTQEINTDNLTATNTGVDIGIDVAATLPISGSTLSVTGNSAGASALGNVGFNRVGLGETDASGNITERVGSIAGGTGNATANATTGNTAVAANALSSSQDLTSTTVQANVGGTVNIGDNAAPLDLSTSTATASNNRFDGELVGNQVGNTIDLFATGASSANAALTSDQLFSTAATNTANGAVSMDFDDITNSTLSATGNAVTATSRANSGDNLLRVDAASISGGTSALASGTGNTESGLAVANRQEVVAGSSVASTAIGSVTAEGNNIDDSTVKLDDNRVAATTLGNRAGNTIDLYATNASTASAALGNDQLIDGQLSGSATGTVTLTVGNDFDLQSTASIQNNETLASVMGNQAGNAIQVESASIGNGAGNNANTGIGGGASTGTGTGQALASRQTFTLAGPTSATATGTYQFIGSSDLSQDGTGSTATISGNVVRSQVDINSAGDSGFTAEQQRQDFASSGNLIDLQATGAITDPAALANTQTISAGLNPAISANTTATFGMTLGNDIEQASVVTVTDNVAQALVRGNNALNEVSVDAGGEIAAGATGAPARAQVGNALIDPTEGGFVSANRQIIADSIITTATVNSNALVTVEDMQPGDGAVVDVSGNLAWSQATLNRGINTMTLGSVSDPASSVTAKGALLNEQDAGTGTVTTTTTANVGLTVTQGSTPTVANDAVSVSDNRSIAAATSNQANNAISVNATGAIASPQAAPAPSSVSVNAGLGQTVASGDIALTNRQDSGNAMNTLVGSAGTAMDGTTINIGGNSTNTPLSVDRNTLWAETFANSATSSIALNGAGVGAAAGVASVQSNSGNLSSLVQNTGDLTAGPSIDITVGGVIADSAVSMANNQVRATATANDAVNTLSATSMTGVTSETGASPTATATNGGSSVADAGLSVLNAQDNTGDVVSGAFGNSISFTAGSYNNTNGGAVALNGNMIAANSTGNRAVNSASVDGLGRSTTPVGVANHQRNSGNTLSSTVNNASINASFTGGGTGSMAVSSRNNTIAATTQGNVSGNSVSTGNAISRASGRLNR